MDPVKRLVVAVLLPLLSATVLRAQSPGPRETAPGSDSRQAVASYPESPDGLKHFVDDIIASVRAGNTEKTSAYFSSLAIPNSGAWFATVFGPEEGRRLEAKYAQLVPQLPDSLNKRFKYAMDGGRTEVKITVLQKPADPAARLGRAITDAMIQPIAIYSASGTSPTEKYSAYIGDFVFVDGAFRLVDMEVFQALSSAPPMRIRQGGNVTLTALVHKTAPAYPEDARAARTQGSVVLHVIIGTDGMVKQAEPVSGDPSLAKAAVEAVKQWMYKPTLLNGQPVEVDTTVTLDFHL